MSMCIGITYFAHKRIHKRTWLSPDGNSLNEIDYVCINKMWQGCLLDVRTHKSPDFGSDQYLLVGMIKLKLKIPASNKREPPIAVEKPSAIPMREHYKNMLYSSFSTLEEVVGVAAKWANFRDTMVDTFVDVVGNPTPNWS